MRQLDLYRLLLQHQLGLLLHSLLLDQSLLMHLLGLFDPLRQLDLFDQLHQLDL